MICVNGIEKTQAFYQHKPNAPIVMKEQGGYIPTCDHGVPEEVEFEDYLHFRKRLLEYAD